MQRLKRYRLVCTGPVALRMSVSPTIKPALVGHAQRATTINIASTSRIGHHASDKKKVGGDEIVEAPTQREWESGYAKNHTNPMSHVPYEVSAHAERPVGI